MPNASGGLQPAANHSGELPHRADGCRVGLCRDWTFVLDLRMAARRRNAARAALPARRRWRSRRAARGGRGRSAQQTCGGDSASSSAGVKPPSGPTSSAAGAQRPGGGAPGSGEGQHADPPARRPALRRAARRAQHRHGEALALLGRFRRRWRRGGRGSRARRWCARSAPAAISGDAEFGRLAHREVGRIALEQREQQDQRRLLAAAAWCAPRPRSARGRGRSRRCGPATRPRRR